MGCSHSGSGSIASKCTLSLWRVGSTILLTHSLCGLPWLRRQPNRTCMCIPGEAGWWSGPEYLIPWPMSPSLADVITNAITTRVQKLRLTGTERGQDTHVRTTSERGQLRVATNTKGPLQPYFSTTSLQIQFRSKSIKPLTAQHPCNACTQPILLHTLHLPNLSPLLPCKSRARIVYSFDILHT